MSDSFISNVDLKIGYSFNSADDPTQWITLPNPLPQTSQIKNILPTIENLAVQNNLLLGSRTKSNVKEIAEAKVIAKSETGLDWRS